jgi:hypothetical protein
MKTLILIVILVTTNAINRFKFISFIKHSSNSINRKKELDNGIFSDNIATAKLSFPESKIDNNNVLESKIDDFNDNHLYNSSTSTVLPSLTSASFMAELVRYISNSPSALANGAFSGIGSYLSSAALLIPAALLMNSNVLFQSLSGPAKGGRVGRWVFVGSEAGLDWARVSALYSFGEAFCEKLRGRSDRVNSYFGSGLASAVLAGGAEGGWLGAAKGFASGSLLLLAIDKIAAVPSNSSLTAAPAPQVLQPSRGKKFARSSLKFKPK